MFSICLYDTTSLIALLPSGQIMGINVCVLFWYSDLIENIASFLSFAETLIFPSSTSSLSLRFIESPVARPPRLVLKSIRCSAPPCHTDGLF